MFVFFVALERKERQRELRLRFLGGLIKFIKFYGLFGFLCVALHVLELLCSFKLPSGRVLLY